MITAFSTRRMQPFSGQVQIAQGELVRALTLDGLNWEFQYQLSSPVHMQHNGVAASQQFRLAFLTDYEDITAIAAGNSPRSPQLDRLFVELAEFIIATPLPYAAQDRFECWLLDASDQSPLALLYTCATAEQQAGYPQCADWRALPASMMPVERTSDELVQGASPINSLFERLIEKTAGWQPSSQWVDRDAVNVCDFPPMLVRHEWDDPDSANLANRYLDRQAPRLLMLHTLSPMLRMRLETVARNYALEVEKYHSLYPEIADKGVIDATLVEARLRLAANEKLTTFHLNSSVIHNDAYDN